MMQSNFKIVFKVEVFHTYFENNICNCLHFKPGPVLSSLIKRFGFIIREQVNGFILYASSANNVAALLSYIQTATGATFFDFDICTDNENFSNFTDIPIDWMGQLVYDSQSAATIQDGDITQLVESFLNNISTLYTGSLTIHFDDIVKGATRFNINYNARATQWQYFVINKSAVPFNDPSIVGKAGFTFNSPENVTMEDGEQALMFSSGHNLIPLSQLPKHTFDLVNNATRNGSSDIKKSPAPKVIFKGLPNPVPRQAGIGVNGAAHQVSSLMYVYI